MFTIFKKIRKRLFDAGSGRKYFIYALGEIVFEQQEFSNLVVELLKHTYSLRGMYERIYATVRNIDSLSIADLELKNY